MEKIYEKIAKENGVSVEEIKQDIQEAINSAYEKPNLYARCIPSKGNTPTTDEFIEYVANRMTPLP